MVSLSMQGQTGPHSGYRGFGWLLQGLSGLQYLCGYPDSTPVSPGPQLSDLAGSYFAAVATTAALTYRQKTGKGQYIDISQFEAAVHLLSPMFLDYAVNGREAERIANRHPFAAPHGIFQCQGDDRWCAIGVFTDAQWEKFTTVAKDAGLAGNPRFATLSERKRNEDELEKLIAGWCRNYTPEQVMTMLQAAGVPAGVVQNGKDLVEDPQLQHRGHYQFLNHQEVGKIMAEASGFRLSKTPCELRKAAPIMGEDNDYIYQKFLGIPDEEYLKLMAEGVFT